MSTGLEMIRDNDSETGKERERSKIQEAASRDLDDLKEQRDKPLSDEEGGKLDKERKEICEKWLQEIFEGVDLGGKKLHLRPPFQKMRAPVEQFGVYLGDKHLGDVHASYEDNMRVDNEERYRNAAGVEFLKPGFEYQVGKLKAKFLAGKKQ